MALTALQRDVCQLLAAHRRERGESYVAGGVALNELLGATRRSRDVDVFHDTEEAVAHSWANDGALLRDRGFDVQPTRVMPSFVQAKVTRSNESVVLEWSQDSAFRFFPLVEHDVLGLTLHPFDLATNKVLALVGRREARDWVDAIACDAGVQPLGYLAWAAAGKDPGFGPLAIVEEAARSVRYAQVELDALDFEGAPPDAATLSRQWHQMVAAARLIITALPAEHAGTCVVTTSGDLLRAPPESLPGALASGAVSFHAGSIYGAFPQLR